MSTNDPSFWRSAYPPRCNPQYELWAIAYWSGHTGPTTHGGKPWEYIVWCTAKIQQWQRETGRSPRAPHDGAAFLPWLEMNYL